jgi:plastocyanin
VRFLRFFSMLTALLVFAGCGGGTPPGTPRPGATAPGATAAGATAPGATQAGVACEGSGGTAVSIQSFSYDPPSATVAVGGTATWTNNDPTPHTVTFDSGPDCGQLANAATKSATFSAAGSYAYHCTIHPTMKGTVVVQ